MTWNDGKQFDVSSSGVCSRISSRSVSRCVSRQGSALVRESIKIANTGPVVTTMSHQSSIEVFKTKRIKVRLHC